MKSETRQIHDFMNLQQSDFFDFLNFHRFKIQSFENFTEIPDLKNQLICQTNKIFFKFQQKFYSIESFKNNEVQEYELNKIIRIGHRGSGANSHTSTNSHPEASNINLSINPRENTIESFNLAYKNKAQMVEFDVHLTKDNVLVVYHNNTIKGRAINTMLLDEFKMLSQNSTFDDILENISPKLALYIELKYELTHQENYIEYGIELVVNVCRALKRYPKRKVIIGSFSPLICILVKLISLYKVCFIICDQIYNVINDKDLNEYLIEFIKVSKMEAMVCNSNFCSRLEPIYNSFQQLVKIIYGSGTNSKTEIQRYKDLGVTGFCTDNLDLFK